MTARALLALAFAWQALAAGAADLFNMGFYLPGIRDANPGDVKVTLQLWADEIGGAHRIQATAYTYDDMAALARDAKDGHINMVIAPGMEIAEHFAPEELSIGFSGRHQGTLEGLALVARADGPRRFSELRGKKVARLGNDRLAKIYLETECRRAYAKPCADLFQIAEEKRDGLAIHKVFFGQVDAALVSLSALHAAGELNPQVRQRLSVLFDWPVVSLSFGMLPANVAPALRERILRATMQVKDTARGRQILELFRTDYMSRVVADDLQPFWRLHREYHEVARAVPARKP
jgi:hypothetical protein